MSLKQNNLAEATTELGFPAETNIPLQQEVTLEDGTKVMINGTTPEMLATKLGITFKTPGEPYVTSTGETLNGVVQIYNGDPEPDFETITLGGSYKFKPKEKLDIIDNMSIEELAEFLNIPDNSVFIGIGNIESGIGIVTSYMNGMPIIGITFYKDSNPYGLMYVPQSVVQTAGLEKAGWYTVSQGGQYEPASAEEFVLEEIENIQNNLSSGTPTSLTEYASEKLDWLLVSAKSIQPKTLVSIEVTTPPTKTEYKTGDSFDPTGMVITATFDDESTKVITNYTYSPSGELAESDTKITISYTKGEVTKTAEQSITVKEGLNEITLIPNKFYNLNYKALAEFVEAKLTESEIYDNIKEMPIVGYGCGDNSPAIQSGLVDSVRPAGIIENTMNEIAFGTDSFEYITPLSVSWPKGGTLEYLIRTLKLAETVQGECLIMDETSVFKPSETITINLMNSNVKESFTVNGNINWIEPVE